MERNMHTHQSFIFKQLVEYFDRVQTAEQADQFSASPSLTVMKTLDYFAILKGQVI